ncbi:MAG: DUF192 domain-containing protein [Candidatus Polarisedimenticolia bacterium]
MQRRLPLVFSSLALTALALASPAPGEERPYSAQPFPGPRGEVLLPSGTVLQVELADTPAKMAMGYMFRDVVTDGEGMVFFHQDTGFHSFWMKNCRVSLDLVWMDENWNIVHVERNVPPCRQDPCPSYVPMRASRYVLEVQAGMAGRHNLIPGSRIIYNAPRPEAPELRDRQ